jgi:hypothetical protein
VLQGICYVNYLSASGIYVEPWWSDPWWPASGAICCDVNLAGEIECSDVWITMNIEFLGWHTIPSTLQKQVKWRSVGCVHVMTAYGKVELYFFFVTSLLYGVSGRLHSLTTLPSVKKSAKYPLNKWLCRPDIMSGLWIIVNNVSNS